MVNLRRRTTRFLTASAAVALLAPGCSIASSPDQVPGSTRTGLEPVAAEPPPSDIGVEAPTSGAAVRLGDVESVVQRVACIDMGDSWSMSGSDDAGAKVAVILSDDKLTVRSASVVFDDGRLVDMKEGQGSATIAWQGDTFTISGLGTYMDLAKDPNSAGEQTNFVITSTCSA
ncbi:MAG: lipoprotein LpqH [Propionibacteriaceae bacterium]|nr:lipoprotein LpqH [Propionibacteriaceae bacterium]